MPKECSKGKIYRKAYTRVVAGRKIKVAGACITATSQSGLKRSSIDRRKMSSRARSHRAASKKFGRPRCKQGEIVREGYHRKAYSKRSGSKVSSSWVAPSCIVSRSGSHPGVKGEQLFILTKGELQEFGYENIKDMTKAQRHDALKQALTRIKPLSLFRKLNALYILNKDKDPTIASIFAEDRDWIKTTKQYASRPTSKKTSKRGSKRKSKRRSKK